MTSRIFLAGTEPVVLAGLRALLAEDASMRVVGEAVGDVPALGAAVELGPDVVVWDLLYWRAECLDAVRQLRSDCPDCAIVLLTSEEDSGSAMEFLDAGGSGYILKSALPAELVRAVRMVVDGGTYVDPKVAGRVLTQGRRQDGGSVSRVARRLTEREVDVMRRKVNGYSNKAIAADLRISVKTVETYHTRGMEKLGLNTRRDAIRFAVHRGWVTGG